MKSLYRATDVHGVSPARIPYSSVPDIMAARGDLRQYLLKSKHCISSLTYCHYNKEQGIRRLQTPPLCCRLGVTFSACSFRVAIYWYIMYKHNVIT